MALPAQDAFTGNDGDALDVYSANWTCNDGGSGDDELEIQSNAAAAADDTDTEGAQHWNADSFDNDQYSEATVVSTTSSDCIGVACRCVNSSAGDFYGWYGNSLASFLFECDDLGWTQIGTDGTIFTATDLVRIEAEGTTITGKIDGGTEKSGTNGTHTSGYAGLCAYSVSASARIDDWEGGNLGLETPAISEAESITVSDTISIAMVALAVGKAESITVQDAPTVNVESLVAPLSIAIVATDSTYDIAKPVIVG